MERASRIRLIERQTRVGEFLAACAHTLRALDRVGTPLLALVLRVWIAQTFLVSGLLKVADWSTALELARSEYPVSWMTPASAALVGVTIELVGGLLLALGLATRAAACAMLGLAVTIHAVYRPLDLNLFWAAALAWIACAGAGPISLDAPLSRGLAGRRRRPPTVTGSLTESAWRSLRA